MEAHELKIGQSLLYSDPEDFRVSGVEVTSEPYYNGNEYWVTVYEHYPSEDDMDVRVQDLYLEPLEANVRLLENLKVKISEVELEIKKLKRL